MLFLRYDDCFNCTNRLSARTEDSGKLGPGNEMLAKNFGNGGWKGQDVASWSKGACFNLFARCQLFPLIL